jgi:glucosylceramidase
MDQSIRWIETTAARAWTTRRASAAAKGAPNLMPSGQEHQTWEGWGGCFNELGWIALRGLAKKDRDEVFRELFDPVDGCRFTRCRLPVGASDYGAEWYSHNETDGDYAMRRFSVARDEDFLIPYIRRALAVQPGLELFASPWSPPTWMKQPKAYNYGRLIWTRKNLEAYALYFVKFVQAYRQRGLPLRQIHVQNEPLADQKFPSCLWTGEQLRDFIRDYLGPAFRQHGLDCEIWLGTLNTDDYDGYVLKVLLDPAARALIRGVGFQWAGKGAIQRAAESWPGVRLMQTENECGDGRNSWEYARYIFNLVRHYLANGASAYVYWNMVLPAGGESTWGWKQNSMVTVDLATQEVAYTPEFHLMKHFSRFIEPGAVRLGLRGEWTGNAVAFRNPDGARVVVIQNPLKEAHELVFREERGGFAARLAPESWNTFHIEAPAG